MIGIVLRLSGIVSNCQQYKKRKWKDFNCESFNVKVSEIKWDEMYSMTDPNLVWDFLETNLTETRAKMFERDIARNVSKISNTEEDKKNYRRLRNKVIMDVKKDIKDYFRKQYNKCETENDLSQLYKTAKIQAGWKTNGPQHLL